jgi:S1-C subfamily serine protease
VDSQFYGGGAFVTQVHVGTPAASTGLRATDVITGVGVYRVRSSQDLGNAMKRYEGRSVTIYWYNSSGGWQANVQLRGE